MSKPRIVSAFHAGLRGLKFYFTGKPCERGHIAERRLSSRQCVVCEKQNGQAYRANNRAAIAARRRARHDRSSNV